MNWFELVLRDNEEHTFSNRFRRFVDILYSDYESDYEEELYTAYMDFCESYC